MTVQTEHPRIVVYFWRWLVTGTLLVGVVGTLEYIDISLLLAGSRRRGHELIGGIVFQVIDFLLGGIYLTYALVFFGNYFFFQRFERIAGRQLVSLWLNGAAAMAAGVAASWLVRLFGGGLFFGPFIGLGFGALLWLLHKSHSSVFRSPPRQLFQAHLLGGVIAYIVLLLRWYAAAGSVAPAVAALAFAPHLLLTWRAMRAALVASNKEPTSDRTFATRLLAVVGVLAVTALLVPLLF